MSHQTGIQGSDELTAAFAKLYNSDDTRMLLILIENEEMVLSKTFPTQGSEAEDWDNCVLATADEKEPCYMIFRLDSRNASGYEFVLIAWSPDFAHIKKKMLYAATRATLKQTFGMLHLKAELFGTVTDDISYAGYQRHLVSEAAPPPLTEEEYEKAEIRKAETGVEIGASTKHQIATGVAFPVESKAMSALKDLKAGKITYVQMSLDLSKEEILLAESGSYHVDKIQSLVSDDEPRYHVFNFKHNHEGDTIESTVFIYSCPGFKCSVKQRMMYSTCKSPLIDVVEDEIKLELAKKLEIGESAELTQEFLYDQLHPAKTVFKQKFSRPSRPGKGGRRMVRGGQES
ncbi:uncharacterized protein MONBRDRAFT_31730 [Monosiga brevicollis MX1]|uniref:Twinfilin n=1 Tax=Monosiga brevicollis TaxID=81824 RepID=A9UUB1_MONBE|nr:uncharacterized protein MONBRDRAFT_31730 [Monosiga brevicollis MX1]EDQ91064.1 predicted protein [Monosiga brevicollis MX1]|eukprot:XP_001744361.1 hypothetical protein [Monosiga brevicollis MX1]